MPAELSAKAIAALPPRRSPYWVAPNLYVNKTKSPGFWVLLYASPVKGRRVEMGLGLVRDPALAGAAAMASGLSLIEAKGKALEYRAMILRGRCPLSERQAEQEARRSGHRRRDRGPHIFQDVAEAYIAFHKPTWSNKTHAQQWESTLATYAYPILGHLPVNRIDVEAVLQVLEPIWHDKPETASRVRGRLETIIDYARARKFLAGENPARWRGHLENLLPRKSRLRPVVHQAAMPWRELPAFYQMLSRDRGISALLLRYVIVNALRTGEARLAVVDEIDRANRLHLVPAERTKTRTPLRIPLSDEALRILDQAEARRTSAFLFSGRHVGAPVSGMAALELLRVKAPGLTVHGFRSSFRDWCADRGIARETSESALGHAVGSKVEASYLRSDILDQRRVVMDMWAQFLTTPAGAAEVVVLKAEASRRAG